MSDSKDLVKYTEEELRQLTGQASSGTFKPILPKLGINKDFETDDGKHKLNPGDYKIMSGDQTLYGPVKSFRIFVSAYQYLHWDTEAKKFKNKSIIFKDWNVGKEAIDELGGIKCGKLNRKQLAQLTPGELAKQKEIKCVRQIYGVVTLDKAAQADGTPATVENMPVLYSAGGVHYNPFGEAIEAIEKLRKLYPSFNLGLKSKKEKTGSNNYYSPVVTVDWENEVTLQQVDIDTLRVFNKIIDDDNKVVTAKWQEVIDRRSKPSERAVYSKVIDAEPDASTDELNDDLPESMR